MRTTPRGAHLLQICLLRTACLGVTLRDDTGNRPEGASGAASPLLPDSLFVPEGLPRCQGAAVLGVLDR